MSEQPLAGYHPGMSPIVSCHSITSSIMHGIVWHSKYFLSGSLKVCGVIFRQQHIQFGLGQGWLGRESVMQKLIQLFYKRRSTLHQWMGNLSPRGSSHNTIDDDKTRKLL